MGALHGLIPPADHRSEAASGRGPHPPSWSDALATQDVEALIALYAEMRPSKARSFATCSADEVGVRLTASLVLDKDGT
jgi:hypothetical protein